MTVQYSIQKMVSDGTLSTIALGIQYLQRNDIYMRIAGEETPQSGAPSGYTWSFIDNTTLKILPVVPNGVEVVVYRRTDVDVMYNIYSQNAQFDEATIDENNQQLLYIAQEYLEQGIPGAGVDIIEFIRDDGSFTYYRIKRTDGSYSDEFYVPSAGSITKVLARESLRRSYAEAGYNLVDGSFEVGGTLVNVNDVLLQEHTGKAFSGPAGMVAAGTNPTSVGFVDVSVVLLRDSIEVVVRLSNLGFVGDGSPSDDAILSNAFALAASTGRKLIFDVDGIYSQVNFASNVTAHVTKDMTLKSNTSTTPQSVQDSLFVFNGTTNFKITFNRDVILRGGNHAVYQEFSHCVRLQGGCNNGYIGPHKSLAFDGDGLYINNASDVVIDTPIASQPGRNGISVVGTAIRVTINEPYTAGINQKAGALNLSAIDIEPNNACDFELDINSPSGFGDSVRAAGLQMYMERNALGTPLGKRQFINIVNPVYTKFLKNYTFVKTFWDLATGDSVMGSFTIQNPKSYDHINNAYYVDSWQPAGGVVLAVDNPSVVVRHSVPPQAVIDAGRVICFTRNQAVYDDVTDAPAVDFTGVSIVDNGLSGHSAYIFSRYAETVVMVDISSFITKQPNIPVVVFGEVGKGSLGTAKIAFRAPRYLVKIASATLSFSDCLYIISNRGATSDVTHLLPILPVNQLVTFENVVSDRTVNIRPPNGMRINFAAVDAPYALTQHKSVTLKRINSSDYAIV